VGHQQTMLWNAAAGNKINCGIHKYKKYNNGKRLLKTIACTKKLKNHGGKRL
jgi:hypothetical protein